MRTTTSFYIWLPVVFLVIFSVEAQVPVNKVFVFEVDCVTTDSSLCAMESNRYTLYTRGSELLLSYDNNYGVTPISRVHSNSESPFLLIDDEEEIVFSMPFSQYASFDSLSGFKGGLLISGDTTISNLTYQKKTYLFSYEGSTVLEENVYLTSASQINENAVVSRLFIPVLMQSDRHIPQIIRRVITAGEDQTVITIRLFSENILTDYTVFDIPNHYRVLDFQDMLK